MRLNDGVPRGDGGFIARRPLARQRLELTELSLGGAQLGNLYREVSDADAASTVDAAWELGVRYFDTAPHYGLGLSERRLGAALASRPRTAYVISSKVGRRVEPAEPAGARDDEGFAVPATHRRVWDFSRDGIRRSLDASLQRLDLDRLDIVYLHDPDDHMTDALATGYPALDELRDEGVVTAIGAGMNSASLLADLVRETDLDLVMLAGRYTLLEQGSLDDLLPLCGQRGVAVVAAGVFNTGLLARPHPPPDARYNYAQAPPALVERARAIAAVCARHGTTLPAAALAFPLAHPAVVSVCVGPRSADQMRENAARHGEAIAPDVWRELKAERLLRGDAPVPGVGADGHVTNRAVGADHPPGQGRGSS
jgi:D-threo-aldose 1-dehydrogenase